MHTIAIIALVASTAEVVQAPSLSPAAEEATRIRTFYRLCLTERQSALYSADLARKSIYPLLDITNEAVFPTIARGCAAASASFLDVAQDPAAARAAMAIEDSIAAAVVTRNAAMNRPALTERADAIKAPGPRPAVLIAAPEVSADDYPNAAMRNGESGTATATFVIGIDGRAAQCTASGSSDTLNTAACQMIERRSRYAPAIDSAGLPLDDRGTLSITFKIP